MRLNDVRCGSRSPQPPPKLSRRDGELTFRSIWMIDRELVDAGAGAAGRPAIPPTDRCCGTPEMIPLVSWLGMWITSTTQPGPKKRPECQPVAMRHKRRRTRSSCRAWS